MSRLIVLDTNCLVQIISVHSPYRSIWKAFLQKRYVLCVSNEILNEYQEILERHTTAEIAENVMIKKIPMIINLWIVLLLQGLIIL